MGQICRVFYIWPDYHIILQFYFTACVLQDIRNMMTDDASFIDGNKKDLPRMGSLVGREGSGMDHAVSFSVQHPQHVIHGGDVAVKLFFEGVSARAALQGRAPGVGGDGGLHLPAVHVVEHHSGHPVAVRLKLPLAHIVHRPVGVFDGAIELHIGEDIEHGRHFFLLCVGVYRRAQDQVEHAFQVGAAAPIEGANVAQLVPQGAALDFNQVGIALEGDQAVVEHTRTPFGAVQPHGLGNECGLERTEGAVHGPGRVHYADGVLAADLTGQAVPQRFQGGHAIGVGDAPPAAVEEGPKHFIGEQRFRMDALAALFYFPQEIAEPAAVFVGKGAAVFQHGLSGHGLIVHLVRVLLGQAPFHQADAGAQGGQHGAVFPGVHVQGIDQLPGLDAGLGAGRVVGGQPFRQQGNVRVLVA